MEYQISEVRVGDLQVVEEERNLHGSEIQQNLRGSQIHAARL